MKKSMWLVGGSSGIGLAFANLWLNDGHLLTVSSRHATTNKELLHLHNQYPDQLHLVNLDVTDQSSIETAVHQAWEYYGGLDYWFYNAGSYESQPISQWDMKHFESMNSTNYMGAAKIMKELYPLAKEGIECRWILNISLASYFGLPLGGGYSAPKAALLNLAQSVQPELLDDNIKLQVINHGFVKTRLTAKNSFKMPQLMEVEAAAQKIFEAIQKPYRFEITFPKGLRYFLRFLTLIPNSWALKITKRVFDASK